MVETCWKWNWNHHQHTICAPNVEYNGFIMPLYSWNTIMFQAPLGFLPKSWFPLKLLRVLGPHRLQYWGHISFITLRQMEELHSPGHLSNSFWFQRTEIVFDCGPFGPRLMASWHAFSGKLYVWWYFHNVFTYYFLTFCLSSLVLSPSYII